MMDVDSRIRRATRHVPRNVLPSVLPSVLRRRVNVDDGVDGIAVRLARRRPTRRRPLARHRHRGRALL